MIEDIYDEKILTDPHHNLKSLNGQYEDLKQIFFFSSRS